MYREVAVRLDVHLNTGQLPEPPAPVFYLDPAWLIPEPYDRIGNPQGLEVISVQRWLVNQVRRVNQVEVTGPATVPYRMPSDMSDEEEDGAVELQALKDFAKVFTAKRLTTGTRESVVADIFKRLGVKTSTSALSN